MTFYPLGDTKQKIDEDYHCEAGALMQYGKMMKKRDSLIKLSNWYVIKDE